MQFIPNAITVSRILVTPFLIYCISQKTAWFASAGCVLFMVAAISDFADGYVARKFKGETRFGRHLDPLADKILVIGLFVALAWFYPEYVPWWAVGILVCRDVVITGLRLIADTQNRILSTLSFAKFKTAFQMSFLGILLLLIMFEYFPMTDSWSQYLLQGWFVDLALILVVVITGMTALSYIRIYFYPKAVS
ncbi:MAG: CDP-diacylglycerol--glycerol-3-phosphate 3-phosphatidyltransferase [Bacteroidetes bacterium]|nr:CDP-diacylglycerol--glycerol-3-phosphate 3-phosphatidyltransferase [Bacteroidota bacterium]MCY4224609.1 CDP-diacylglycerol--glycerol-3-phosphate 3-phosphatidyltransferase [Bacteroidota bacterium]